MLLIKAGKQGLVSVLNEKESNMLFAVRAMEIGELNVRINDKLENMQRSFK